MIAKTLSTSQRYASLHHEAGALAEFCQALYPLLVAHADDSGRLQGDAFTVKHAVCPSSPRQISEVEQALQALDTVRLIAWYESDRRKFIEIKDFAIHQPGLKNRDNSKIPPVPGNAVTCREMPPELKGTELKGTEEKRTKDSAVPLCDTTPAAVLTFPTTGNGPKSWALTDAQIAEWQTCYPGIDVESECRKALAWVKAKQQKTARGMPAFLVNWFNRAADRGGTSRPIQAVSSGERWVCPHVRRCDNPAQCEQATILDRPRKAHAS